MTKDTQKLFIKASSFLDNNELDQALLLFLKLLSLGDKSANLNIGYIYDKMGKRNKAKEHYKNYIDEANDTSAMINLGIIYKEEYKLKKAEKWFKRAMQLGDGDGALMLGKLYLSKADLVEAIRCFDLAIESDNVCDNSKEEAGRLREKIKNNISTIKRKKS